VLPTSGEHLRGPPRRQGVDQVTAARVPKGAGIDVFAPEVVVGNYQGCAEWALRALLDLVHPRHPDAPTVAHPAPRSLHVPRCEAASADHPASLTRQGWRASHPTRHRGDGRRARSCWCVWVEAPLTSIAAVDSGKELRACARSAGAVSRSPATVSRTSCVRLPSGMLDGTRCLSASPSSCRRCCTDCGPWSGGIAPSLALSVPGCCGSAARCRCSLGLRGGLRDTSEVRSCLLRIGPNTRSCRPNLQSVLRVTTGTTIGVLLTYTCPASHDLVLRLICNVYAAHKLDQKTSRAHPGSQAHKHREVVYTRNVNV